MIAPLRPVLFEQTVDHAGVHIGGHIEANIVPDYQQNIRTRLRFFLRARDEHRTADGEYRRYATRYFRCILPNHSYFLLGRNHFGNHNASNACRMGALPGKRCAAARNAWIPSARLPFSIKAKPYTSAYCALSGASRLACANRGTDSFSLPVRT